MLAATYAIKACTTGDDLTTTWTPVPDDGRELRVVAGLFGNQMQTCCCS